MPQCGGCLPRMLAQFYLAELVSLRTSLIANTYLTAQ